MLLGSSVPTGSNDW